ncbi:MAG: hypothetical protein ACI9X0_001101, partial [Kiritimatiellia bacterium]
SQAPRSRKGPTGSVDRKSIESHVAVTVLK